ncbi:hypothetical protein AB0K74_43040 [Streptomyces sp. NPDC056159]|uniref:hypothetical protein n=1 Tax=Streptomyces sp. NPDC056159 TaxID=3155537 RepID=UPI00343FB6E0
MLRVISDREGPVAWPLTMAEAFTQAMRLPWAVAESTAAALKPGNGVLVAARLLIAGLGTLAYAVPGCNALGTPLFDLGSLPGGGPGFFSEMPTL